MGANRTFDLVVALTTTLTTNIFNCGITSLAGPLGLTLSQPYAILRQFKILNKTGTSATFSLWKGLTGANAAGTEFGGQAKSVPANDALEFWPMARFSSADFLVGGAGTATALTFYATFELGFS
jgi:hypothetical protein